MERISKEQYFLQILCFVAARSTCIRRRVGAILTDEDGHILATGYNGPPKNFDHCIDNPCPGAGDEPGNTSLCMAVHAEQNALLQCKDLDSARILYCSCVPCFTCAKMIANTKIAHIVALERYADEKGFQVLLDAGIVIKIGDQIFGLEEENETT